ncbi:3-phosphoshikimate 1-carboxyvinyltransferase [Hamadaea tsunoensis]|uniref:3-phosphoshikimate 1-carboxyvinyltransferase n=1 Tax=Hamadaea tsunoensis TaxID=53368 RepID=UPI00041FAE7A|nr:3-phosphoshikimate 1-carboxyvinyltransferase [Hamadaea tsunoensis]
MTEVRIPGSKSIMARALFLAAAADGVTTLRRPLDSDDTQAFFYGLRDLGYPTSATDDAATDDAATDDAATEDTATEDTWSVTGSPGGPPVPSADLFTRDAGTATRFLPALVAAGHGTFRFDASDQMRRRPVAPLIDALRQLGVDVTCEQAEGHLPLTVHAAGVKGGAITLDASLSSQFLTAILLLGPLAAEGLRITVGELVSLPYIEITLAMMRRFGATVTRTGDTFVVAPGGYRAQDYLVEPDASSASYFLAAAAVTGRTITVPGLGTESLQGDVRFAEVLARMGADVRATADSLTVTGPPDGRLDGITVNMRDISDTMPTLAAIAPFATGPVRIEDVYNTRVKECDRLETSAVNLRRLGIEVETGRDWIEIQPGQPQAAEILTERDHRIAMSFSVTGLRTPGIVLDDPDCVKKTFPTFHEVFRSVFHR